jgi:hypothetical protein
MFPATRSKTELAGPAWQENIPSRAAVKDAALSGFAGLGATRSAAERYGAARAAIAVPMKVLRFISTPVMSATVRG